MKFNKYDILFYMDQGNKILKHKRREDMNQNPFGGNSGGGDPLQEILRRLAEQMQQNQTNRNHTNQQSSSGPERFDSNGNPVRQKHFHLPKFPKAGTVVVIVLILALYLSRGCYYMLDEENYAVVTTLGNAQTVSQAGLHFKLPLIQHVYLVSKGIKGMAIGYDPGSNVSIDEESVMITRDFNFVNTDFYLEYMVNDPVKYLFASVDPEATLKMLAQSYIRDTVGIYDVDDVITTGKAMIQSEIKEKLTNRMIQEDIGLSVVNITIQDAFPPTDEVMNAFKNVENAKQGKETAINNANKDRNEKIPLAEAECDQIIKNAEAEKEARINEAQGQVSRFEQMYAEYTKYPLITKQRMFYETMEDLLPTMKIYIVDESGTQKLLPLDDFSKSVPVQSTVTESEEAAE
jgi:membrane protease subunit HflK